MTACGHSGCYECFLTALSERSACPCCKRHLTIEGLYEVEEAAEPDARPPASTATSGGGGGQGGGGQGGGGRSGSSGDDGFDAAVSEYGTKVAALVRELGALHASGGKAVVFSAWTRLLRLAEEALQANGLPTASLIGSPAAKRAALAAFAADATVLLVPLFGGASGAGGGGAAGLTLTDASVAVLLEPALQPGIERQAAGRIARIGQTKHTRCIRLIVDGSVESKILQWQQIRLADGASANPTLTLNDFAVLVE